MSDIIEQVAAPVAPINQPSGIDGLLAIAVGRGASMQELERLFELKLKVEADAAAKAFNAALAAFKAEGVTVIKNKLVKDGPTRGRKYAELHAVVSATREVLSRYGLSATWKITRDEPQWIEVTCILRHALGHSEQIAMGGPPDDGGAKTKIQVRASTVTFLERYTLKAILGVAEEGDDNDGAAPRERVDVLMWLRRFNEAVGIDVLRDDWKAAAKQCRTMNDQAAHKELSAVVKALADRWNSGAAQQSQAEAS